MSNNKENRTDIRPQQPTQHLDDDEIDLIDYVFILLKHKTLIVLGSLIPTLVAGFVLFVMPRRHSLSYTYSMAMSETDLKSLEDKFYSAENIQRLVEDLRGQGIADYAQALSSANTVADIRKLVRFEIAPALFETQVRNFSEAREKLDTRGTLLLMHVAYNSTDNLQNIAEILRHNFEQVIPLYLEKNQLIKTISRFKDEMAGIEENRFVLNLQLQRKKSTLEKLKTSIPADTEYLSGNIVLQLDITNSGSDYLPLPYQLQAIQTQLVNLEEEIRFDTEKYNYYTNLLALFETVLNRLNEIKRQRQTLKQFHSFLTDVMTDYAEDASAQDRLAAYIKRIENSMASAVPIVENPTIYEEARETVKITGFVFIAAF
ncbi:MAG TPA: hypothetical protein ENN97_08720, partial [Phycisphaerales bacterium]|nr:hypothetical protein [Phycisphaerales bacterium]